ncbi:hypothetical protein [Shouchella patagoniensis]|uniref:hypothetical protein n=1 Tax=Shouchella patagoniensis TaxID=228576 RepID=UPI001117238D|nr:hypothetical protein [Shouchella patagoniensis]
MRSCLFLGLFDQFLHLNDLVIIGGSMLLGIGIGLFMDNVAAGTLAGIGVGLREAVYSKVNKEEND